MKIKQIIKLHTVVMTFIGLILGILYSFGGLIIDTLVTLEWLSPTSMGTPGLSYGTVLAFGALIGMPIIFGVIGFLTGGIISITYNLIPKWFKTKFQ